MNNRLAEETSPYLILHKDNPVDWRPWGAEAFQEAEASGKPILLSIGYTSETETSTGVSVLLTPVSAI